MNRYFTGLCFENSSLDADNITYSAAKYKPTEEQIAEANSFLKELTK